MKQILLTTALALALALPGTMAAAKDNGPQSVAEGLADLAQASRRPSYRNPPGNVRAEDYHALFGNTVMVMNRYTPWGEGSNGTGADQTSIKLIFIGRDGRYVWCNYRTNNRYETSDHRWAAIKVRRREGLTPLFDNSINQDDKGVLSQLYDAATGEIIFYGPWKRRWWDWNIGHLQARLPAATWTICPDFPSAKELGMEINHKQTAITYDGLMAQDPGRRIRRPDLVTPDPVERE